MNGRHIDHETGEILRPQTVMLRTNEFLKVFNRQNGGRSIKFIKTRTSHKSKRRILSLPNEEAAFLYKISLYASEYNNYLLGDNERGQKGVPLTISDFGKITKNSISTVRRHIKSLQDKKVLKATQLSNGQPVLVINPLYVVNGRRPSPELLHLFSAEIEESGERMD